MALDGGRRGGGGGESSVEDLTRAITDDIRRMPGNSTCCDCGAPGSQSINQSINQCNVNVNFLILPHIQHLKANVLASAKTFTVTVDNQQTYGGVLGPHEGKKICMILRRTN